MPLWIPQFGRIVHRAGPPLSLAPLRQKCVLCGQLLFAPQDPMTEKSWPNGALLVDWPYAVALGDHESEEHAYELVPEGQDPPAGTEWCIGGAAGPPEGSA